MSFSGLHPTPRQDASLAFLYSVLGSAGFATVGTVAAFLPETDLGLLATYLLFGFLVAATVIGIAAFVIGVPLTLLLARLGWERFWVYPVAGLLAGAFLVLLFPLLPSASRTGNSLEFVFFLPVGALPGFVCGSIWWVAYRRHQTCRTHGQQ